MDQTDLSVTPPEQLSIAASREFVIETAKANIAKVSADRGYVAQAKQVNAALASLVAMERNAVMLDISRRQRKERHPVIDVQTVPKLPGS